MTIRSGRYSLKIGYKCYAENSVLSYPPINADIVDQQNAYSMNREHGVVHDLR